MRRAIVMVKRAMVRATSCNGSEKKLENKAHAPEDFTIICSTDITP